MVAWVRSAGGARRGGDDPGGAGAPASRARCLEARARRLELEVVGVGVGRSVRRRERALAAHLGDDAPQRLAQRREDLEAAEPAGLGLGQAQEL